MQTVTVELDELKKIDDKHSVICPTGFLERDIRLDRLPRGGDRTRFVIRDAKAEAVYRVAWRRSDFGPQPRVGLAMVRSTGTPGDVEQLLVKAGFRPIKLAKGMTFRAKEVKRVLQMASELRGQRVRVSVRDEAIA